MLHPAPHLCLAGAGQVALRVVPREVGFGFGIEQVFEYQRRQLFKEPQWGAEHGYLLPTDPGARGWQPSGAVVAGAA